MERSWVWPFELLDKIGEGGMGVVYRARYVGNNRQVAVKLLPEVAAANKTLLARFEREMEILKQLRHPHIVHCFGGTCESKQHFYAMELVEGGTLADVIRERGQLSWDVAIDYAIQMCEALEYAHQRGIIHRDIKPSNFLVTKQGQLKLSDFGLVTVVAGQKLTATGRTLGTVDYMSPEQIRGKPPLTTRSDLYALGCVIYEMLTGRAPYTGDSQIQILHAHLHDPIPRLLESGYDGPVELDQLVFDLLAKSPGLRPESAADVCQSLKDILQPGRHFKPMENPFVPKRAAPKPTNPLAGVSTSGSQEVIVVTNRSVRANWGWLAAASLAVVCLIFWIGRTTANSQLSSAERVLIEELSAKELPTQLHAANALAKFPKLHPTTIQRLNEVTQKGPEQLRIAALVTLASHPVESRRYQWEIYKLQKNIDVSTAVRNQADLTFAAIKRTNTGASSTTSTGWIMLVVAAAIAAAGWWAWQRFGGAAKIAHHVVNAH